jgi:hypothetical protein
VSERSDEEGLGGSDEDELKDRIEQLEEALGNLVHHIESFRRGGPSGCFGGCWPYVDAKRALGEPVELEGGDAPKA